ncbi:MAG: hypothetical protein JWN69_2043 [Alphaproteobacteria bacterium]|nr:hypothetical protein [Alphaproteobacteria bacterium]
MSEPTLIYEKRGPIAYITFNRPEARNALDPEAMCRLADAWQDYAEDDDLRVAILTGTGDKAFTAGADLGKLVPLWTGARQPQDEWDRRIVDEEGLSDRATLKREWLYKPVVSAINGFCIGAGAEILQATDIRIAAEHATISVNEVTIGFMPGGGSAVRLARQIPFCKVNEMLLAGERISAAEAHRFGLVNEVVPQDRLIERAEYFAHKIAANAPFAVRKTKETIWKTMTIPYADGWKIEAENAALTMASEDAKEGPRAFMEKRPPRFTGR